MPDGDSGRGGRALVPIRGTAEIEFFMVLGKRALLKVSIFRN